MLELVLTNDENMVESISYNSPLGLSDHLCLVFDIQCYWKVAENRKPRRLFHRAKYDDMRKALQCTEWDDELRLIDLNGSATKVMWDNFKEQMQKVIEKYVPLSSKKERRHAISPGQRN